MSSLDAVSAADFKARYLAFKDADAGQVGALLDEARGMVNDTWIEADRKPALFAYTAYLLASEQAVGNAIGVGDGLTVGLSGAVSEIWVGDVKAKFADGGSGGGGSASSEIVAASPAAAFYWQQYQRLYRRSFPGVMVV